MNLTPFALVLAALPAVAQEDHGKIKHSGEAHIVDHDSEAFLDPPKYATQWQLEESLGTYEKSPIATQRPMLEWGRSLYREGPFRPGINIWGEKNLFFPGLMIYGDWRTAAGYSDAGAFEVGRLATRLNLDIDIGLTATERIHMFMRPFDKNGQFTRIDFAGDTDGEEELELDGNLDTLFFEGDLGAMFGGPGVSSMPIAFGKMPLLFQNGVWVEDAFTGVAVTVPAKNSPRFDIANYDWTFFAGFDDVNSAAILNGGGNDHDATIVGVTGFIEAMEGYWEVGYGYTAGDDAADDFDYHNLTAAFSKRYFGRVSNSLRTIINVGQDAPSGASETADGVLFLIENSLITRKPSTLIPYFNLFLGLGNPQSLARAADAGGVLKNTGINFEADALTAFPRLDDTGSDAWGAAIGVEYLFNLDQQVVFEVAGLHPHGSDATAMGDEFAVGARWQKNLTHRWILRADAMAGFREEEDDIAGVRVEFRWKF